MRSHATPRSAPLSVEALARRAAIDSIFVGRGLWGGRLRPGAHTVKVIADGYFPIEALILIALSVPRYDDTLGIYAQRDGYGRFDPETLSGAVTAVLMPVVGARYDF